MMAVSCCSKVMVLLLTFDICLRLFMLMPRHKYRYLYDGCTMLYLSDGFVVVICSLTYHVDA